MLIGALFGVSAMQFDIGTLTEMGPGYFPLAVAVILVILGVGIIVNGVVTPSLSLSEEDREAGAPPTPAQFGSIPWRPVLCVTAAVLFFALTFDILGLLPTAFGTVVLASIARRSSDWKKTLLSATVLTALSWLIFVVALQLRVPLIGS